MTGAPASSPWQTAAAKRHRARGETPCGPCADAEQEDWRLRKRDQRARKNKPEIPTAIEERAA